MGGRQQWNPVIKSFERFPPECNLRGVSKLTKVSAILTLVLWGLAAMHCQLEAVPGLGFLKSCCSVDGEGSVPRDCGDDGCSTVEDGKYRPEERTASAPKPQLIPAAFAPVNEAPIPELQAVSFIAESPPELPRSWQFAHRTALLPRAPSLAS